jgi:hypothetical protein
MSQQKHERQIKAEHEIGKLLFMGSLRGLWTLEDLDKPSPHAKTMQVDIERIARRAGTTPAPYRNLAREWSVAFPVESDQLFRASLEAENIDEVLPTPEQIVAAAMGSSIADNRF